MRSNLTDVTRDFARGEAPLEVWRRAARAERFHRHLAEEVLKLITEWEDSAWDSAWSRNELRARAKQLVPPDLPAPTSSQDATDAMYGPGLRGQKRRP